MKRDSVPFAVSRLIDWRPVRWSPPQRSVGDYDGRERTLEVFNADARDQLELLRRIDVERLALEHAAGGPIVIVFHSVRQSAERHGDFVQSWPRRVDPAKATVAAPETCVDTADESGPHRVAA